MVDVDPIGLGRSRRVAASPLICDPIDPNGAKGEPVELHKPLPPKLSASRYFGVAAPQL